MSTNQLEIVEPAPDSDAMPRAQSPALWEEFRAQLTKLKTTAETITVTDISQTAEMKIARTTRLTLRELRVAIEHKRKELGEEALRRKQKIDAEAKELRDIIEPLEARLLEQEQFIERETARIEDEKSSARTAELTPFMSAPIAVDLGKMPDADYSSLLQATKDAHAAKIERERKEAAEAAARAKAEAEERERVRLENERLKKEAAEREEAARKEREAAAAEKARLEKIAEDERKAAQAKLDAEKKRAEEAAKAAAEKARKEREAIEEAARLQSVAAEEKARVEREAGAAIAAAIRKQAEDERKKRELIEAEFAAKKAAEEKAEAARLAAEKKAAAAPDKAKLASLAEAVRKIAIPNIANAEVRDLISEQRDKFSAWILKQSEAL